MSESRSQATPAREDAKNELATAVLELLNRAAQIGTPGRAITAHVVARGLTADGWSKPRMVTSTVELMALPLGSLIRALLHGNQSPGTVFERVGKEWLELDPSDRDDGEQTIPSAAIFRVYKHGVFVLFTPDGE